jgi:hypothetical protein
VWEYDASYLTSQKLEGMTQYIARIELHAASYPNYEFLHVQMAQRGFVRTLVGENRTTYQLPIGTYVLNSNTTLKDALDRAVEAADATLKTSAVIVAEWTAAMWQGLVPVKQRCDARSLPLEHSNRRAP